MEAVWLAYSEPQAAAALPSNPGNNPYCPTSPLVKGLIARPISILERSADALEIRLWEL